jgi:hypothetical protein
MYYITHVILPPQKAEKETTVVPGRPEQIVGKIPSQPVRNWCGGMYLSFM